MVFKCGIIGLPNVGKSTLFNVLTSSSVRAENFPFCTIKANKAFVPILDVRLNQLAKLIGTTYVVHGNIEVIDIAGLIKGASQGEGLGNKFLSDISEVDILCHVVRCFDKNDIYHINSNINPKQDVEIVHDELILSDIGLCEYKILSFEKNIPWSRDKNKAIILSLLKKCLIHLNNRSMLYNMTLSTEELVIIKYFNFLTLKPMIYIANTSTDKHINNDYMTEVSILSLNTHIPYIAMCILSEKQSMSLQTCNISSHAIFSKPYLQNSKIFDMVKIIYRILQLKTFFTTNMKEVRAWIVAKNTLAIQAANMIHSDFEKGFIRVQVVRYNDFIVCQGFLGSKKFGKVKSEGKNYLIQDGDILNFLI